MISIVILGTGNVATHLFDAFSKVKNVEIKQVYGRNQKALAVFENTTATSSSFNEIIESDIYIIAVSDNAIANVSQALQEKEGLVVHTSGSIPMTAIRTKRKGVFYPLQTFTKGKPVNFSEIPICIEAEHQNDLSRLEQLAKHLSKEVHQISTKQREKLHLSAVLVNNFTNHMYHWASEISQENTIPFHLLQPLISETVDKMRYLSPLEAQTGPARRNDIETMQHHIGQLKSPIQKKIYQLMSESIKSVYEEKL